MKVVYTCKAGHDTEGTLGDGGFCGLCHCGADMRKMVVIEREPLKRNPEYCKQIIDYFDMQTGQHYFDKAEERCKDRQLGVGDAGISGNKRPEGGLKGTIFSFPRL